MIGRSRSWLYVPAHRPELLPKAMAGPADAVVYDLEDAVPPAVKDEARGNALAAVGAAQPKPLWVRVNDPNSMWGKADVATLAGSAVDGVRIPKCTDPTTVTTLAEQLATPLHLLVESALGVENAFVLADSHPRVAGVSLGESDLLADLRIRDPTALDWARQRIITANRAAGLPSPPHAVWTDIHDVDGLVADSENAKHRGFFGRSVLHPSQVESVNRVFTPSHEEVEHAYGLLSSLHEQREGGTTAWIDDHGRFVDPAIVARSRWLIELADRLNEESATTERTSDDRHQE